MRTRDDILAGLRASQDSTIGDLTPEALLDAYRNEVLREAGDATVAWLAKKAREHRAQGPQYAKQADVISRLADKANRGAVRIFLEAGAAEPLVVSRFDTAMEPASEEEQVLTIGCIADDGRPVALRLDVETRAKVARWLGGAS